MKAISILRLTRHEADEEQLSALKSHFGDDVKVERISETLPANAREAVSRFDELASGADVVDAVLPIGLMESVLKFSNFSKRGGLIIRAAMNRSLVGEKAVFTFDHYDVIEKVEIVSHPLTEG